VRVGTVPTFGFTGELQDAAGLVDLRARWYHAADVVSWYEWVQSRTYTMGVIMSMTLAIPDRLEALLRTLAAQRGVSVEALGEHALVVGLTTLAGTAPTDIVDISAAPKGAQLSGTLVPMRSPIVVHGPVRPILMTIEPDPGMPTDAH
jgi:hypothetical protein